MANSIDLATKMIPYIDEVFKVGAKTAILEAPREFVQDTMDADTIKVAKLALIGLGNYSKSTGYPAGDISLSWETHTFSNDRARRFSIDRMDNIESLDLVAGRMVGTYLRNEVIPEIDAYRFAKIAQSALTAQTASGTLTSATTKAAIDKGLVTLLENEVEESRLVIFATPTVAQYLGDDIDRTVANSDRNINTIVERYNGVEIIRVPQTRFYTEITLNPGTQSDAGGYVKTAKTDDSDGGKDINFIIMDRHSAFCITKLLSNKVFTPDQNQIKDAWQFDFRAYHDCFVFENAAKGIYLSTK